MIEVALANDVIHFAEYLIKFQASRVYIYIVITFIYWTIIFLCTLLITNKYYERIYSFKKKKKSGIIYNEEVN